MLLFLVSWIQAQLVFLRREEGQDLAEYALLIALIAIAVVGAVTFLGDKISTVLSSIAAAFSV
jgi:pilus assembly protein Flp/PilA